MRFERPIREFLIESIIQGLDGDWDSERITIDLEPD